VASSHRSTGPQQFPLYGERIAIGHHPSANYSYDANGARVRKDTARWSYAGNVKTFADETKRSWQRTSDALGRLTSIVEPSGAQTNYTYDVLDNLRTRGK
jgi:YD repeat-containing protein